MSELHWLLVWKQVDLTTATLVYRSLSCTALAYLAVDCQPIRCPRMRNLLLILVTHINTAALPLYVDYRRLAHVQEIAGE